MEAWKIRLLPAQLTGIKINPMDNTVGATSGKRFICIIIHLSRGFRVYNTSVCLRELENELVVYLLNYKDTYLAKYDRVAALDKSTHNHSTLLQLA